MVQLGIIKEDNIMSDNTNNGFPVPEEPLTRVEQYLSAIAGVTSSSDIPEEPLTRIEAYLNKIIENGGGGGGTSDYDDLDNRPQVNSHTLTGNMSSSDLGLQSDVMTGYEEPSATGAIEETDTVLEAMGKLEKKADDNQSNISSFHKASGTDVYYQETEPTVSDIPTGSYWISTSGVKTYGTGATKTGALPITFVSNGDNLSDYTIIGANGGVGEQTENIFNKNVTWYRNNFTDSTNHTDTSTTRIKSDIQDISDSNSYMSLKIFAPLTNMRILGIGFFGDDVTTPLQASTGTVTNTTVIQPIPAGAKHYYILLGDDTGGITSDTKTALASAQICAIYGNTLPSNYIPYGYFIPVTCGGATKNIYIDNQLGASDSISYATAQVDIPTTNGSNTLTVGTTVQPTSISITYTGWK